MNNNLYANKKIYIIIKFIEMSVILFVKPTRSNEQANVYVLLYLTSISNYDTDTLLDHTVCDRLTRR